MFSLDANIIFYAADKASGSRHLAAKQLLNDSAGLNAALTEQALFEFFHSTTRKGRIPVADALVIVRGLARNFAVLHAQDDTLEHALTLFSQHKLSIWDARVLAVCAANQCETLLSEDMQDGAQYGLVRVINPFNAKNSELLHTLLAG